MVEGVKAEFSSRVSSEGTLRGDAFLFTKDELEQALGFKLPVGGISDAMARVLPAYRGTEGYRRERHEETRDTGDVVSYRGLPALKAPGIPDRGQETQEIQYVRTSKGPAHTRAHFYSMDVSEALDLPRPLTGLDVSLGLYTVKSVHERGLGRVPYMGRVPEFLVNDAVTVMTDVSDPSQMPVRVYFGRGGGSLDIHEPQTREQALAALQIIGEAAQKIKNGQKVSFEQFRSDMALRAGLSVDESAYLKKELTDSYRGIAAVGHSAPIVAPEV